MSVLPLDQRVQTLCGNDDAATDALGAQTARSDMVVDRGPAQAGDMAGFADAVGDFRKVRLFGRHGSTSLLIERGETSAVKNRTNSGREKLANRFGVTIYASPLRHRVHGRVPVRAKP